MVIRYLNGQLTESFIVFEIQSVDPSTLSQSGLAFDLQRKQLCLRLSDGTIYRFSPVGKQRVKTTSRFNVMTNSQMLAAI